MPKRFYKINYQYFDDFIDMEQTHIVYVCAKNPKAATDIVKHHNKDFLCVLSLELVSAEEVGTSSFLTNDIQQAPEEKTGYLNIQIKTLLMTVISLFGLIVVLGLSLTDKINKQNDIIYQQKQELKTAWKVNMKLNDSYEKYKKIVEGVENK